MEVKVDESKNQPKEELSNVQVNLDDKNEPILPEKSKDEPKYVRVEDLERINQAINNTREWNGRKVASLEQKIDQLLKGGQQQIQPKSDTPVTEWDQKLQKDWKGTVEELAEQRVQKILLAQKEQSRVEQEQIKVSNLLENNKVAVIKKHPELNDEGSQKADIYRQIIQERQEYLNNPFGPVLAMRDMEDRLREQGVYDEPVRQAVNKEVARQARTNSSAVAKGSANPSAQKTITLTKEQKEFCDANNLKYESYAKYSSMLANKREVEA